LKTAGRLSTEEKLALIGRIEAGGTARRCGQGRRRAAQVARRVAGGRAAGRTPTGGSRFFSPSLAAHRRVGGQGLIGFLR